MFRYGGGGTCFPSVSSSVPQHLKFQATVKVTYHPLTETTEQILLNNFHILKNDPETGWIFTEAPLVAYRLDRNIRNMLVHTADRSHTADSAGTVRVPCNHPICRTCRHVSSSLTVNAPNRSINIKGHFSCHSSNLIYCMSSLLCTLNRGDRSHTQRTFGGHLRSIEKKSPGFPIAEHFNGLQHAISDAEIRGIKLCTGNNIHRKKQAMRLIFKLGAKRPRGMNINFSFF